MYPLAIWEKYMNYLMDQGTVVFPGEAAEGMGVPDEDFRKMALLGMMEKVESNTELSPRAKESIIWGLSNLLYEEDRKDGVKKKLKRL